MISSNAASEWKECRDSISRFDGYLFRLRLSVFTVFSLALSALVGTSSVQTVTVILKKPEVVIFIFTTLSTYMLAIYILDRYYERMLMIAVYRASYIETFRLENFKIGLTTEIEFQKEQMLKDANKTNFFLRFGIKGSEMVNVIYLFLFILIGLFTLSFLVQSIDFGWKEIVFFLGLASIFMVLAIIANHFLLEPKLLIKLRSQAVKSPIVVSKEEISLIVSNLSERLFRDFDNKKLLIVSILNGARPFTTDLMNHLRTKGLQFDLHLIRIESTKDNEHLGRWNYVFGDNFNYEGYDVLIVDDLIDTGKTIEVVKSHVVNMNPKSLSVCALINKFCDTKLKAEYVGLELGFMRTDFPNSHGVKDFWLFGYGMDLNEQFRDLDFIGWVEKRDL